MFEPEHIQALDQLFDEMASQSKPSLQRDITAIRSHLSHFKGQTILQGLDLIQPIHPVPV